MENNHMHWVESWADQIRSYRFPRWEELPEIDFYMDQVITFTEKRLEIFRGEGAGKLITPSIINNYVKLKIIPPPVKKRYSREHIAYLLMICTLKSVMPIPLIHNLIRYRLRTESLSEVYNNFCLEQEAASRTAMERAENEYGMMSGHAEREGDAERALGILSVRMAVYANADKLIAEKLAFLNLQDVAESEDKKGSEKSRAGEKHKATGNIEKTGQ